MATPLPVYLFKHVKSGIQSIQNYCHQWFPDSFTVYQIRCRSGLRPRPRWRSFLRSPRPLVGLIGSTSKGEGTGREEKDRDRRNGKGRGREGEGTRGTGPLTQTPGSAPVGVFKLKLLLCWSTLQSIAVLAVSHHFSPSKAVF